MDNQVDPKLVRIVSTTQKVLGEHVCKPVLSDKYLMKPPFRFLHEIFNSVIETTGFLKDAFSPDELKYENFSSVEDKRLFLKKAIEAIESTTGEKCDVRPSKILAGKEPDKTNALLQLLAKGIKTTVAAKEAAKIKKKKEDKDIPKEESGKKESKQTSKENTKTKSSKVKEESTKQSRTKPIRKASTSSSLANDPSKFSRSNQNSESTQRKTDSRTKLKSSSLSKNEPSSTKVSSHESIKPAGSVRSSPSPSSTLVPKNTSSSSSLTKTKSKQNLLPKKTSSTKITPFSKDMKQSEKTSSKEAVINKSDSKTKLSDKTELPPVNKEGIPLERPVTRTKYRQKNSNDEVGSSSKESLAMVDKEKVGGQLSQNAPEEVDSKEGGETELRKPCSAVNLSSEIGHDSGEQAIELEEGETHEGVEVEEKKSVGNCVPTGRSSSEEEVITEHMNLKISEWRASVTRACSEDTLPDQSFKAGWITQEKSEMEEGGNSKVGKVFESREDCTVQGNRSSSGIVEEDQDGLNSKNELGQQPLKNSRRFSREQMNTVEDLPKRPVTVIMDNEDEEDDDEAFLVQEKVELDRDLALDRMTQGALSIVTNQGSIPLEHRGLLVNQIMETQRELEHFHLQNNRRNPDMQNEMAERDKEAIREVYMKQVESLKDAIQKMAKCANPLANITQRSQDDACLMEIEFRKLRQENERLQRRIDEAKAETSKILYPLTEELALLDNRIEKMDGAIVLAKQRLHVMDEEYVYDFIEPIGQTAMEEDESEESSEKSMLWEFRRGADDDEDDCSKIKDKSMMSVFRKALSVHDHEENRVMFENVSRRPRIIKNLSERHPFAHHVNNNLPPGSAYFPSVNEHITLASASVSNHGNLGSFCTQLSGIGIQHAARGVGAFPQMQIPQFQRPVDKDIRPPWWD